MSYIVFGTFNILHFSSHTTGPTVYISHFSLYSLFLAISTSYSVRFPFCSFSVFLAIFQVLPCEILIFHLFQCFSQYSRSNCFSVSFSTFFFFLTIIQLLQCVFLIIHVFNCFLAYSSSYSVSFFLHVFHFSYHNPDKTVFVSYFPRFSVFSP